ncbi:hypothetical protein C8Q79DRAFT_735493 [Trametes meyenii]|nr:hypothetical protein C8Q79DRAFT_735493 [Trametes meyenii]
MPATKSFILCRPLLFPPISLLDPQQEPRFNQRNATCPLSVTFKIQILRWSQVILPSVACGSKTGNRVITLLSMHTQSGWVNGF